jgi:hypothetical protein
MNRPSLGKIITVMVIACGAMAAAIYFAGTGRTPLAMVGAFIFVTLGGLGFELARRRYV